MNPEMIARGKISLLSAYYLISLALTKRNVSVSMRGTDGAFVCPPV